jgi:hypothetical protein
MVINIFFIIEKAGASDLVSNRYFRFFFHILFTIAAHGYPLCHFIPSWVLPLLGTPFASVSWLERV